MEEAVWDRTLNVNLRGPMFAAKYAIPHMVERGSGVIINTSSLAGTLSEGQRVAYSVSKAGLNALTRHIATRHGKQGIRCVSIALGLTKTPAVTELVPPEMLKGMHSTPPYLGEPEDIANVVAFLASDEARFITGSTIFVDGGAGSRVEVARLVTDRTESTHEEG